LAVPLSDSFNTPLTLGKLPVADVIVWSDWAM
jgi:hypothetical protein